MVRTATHDNVRRFVGGDFTTRSNLSFKHLQSGLGGITPCRSTPRQPLAQNRALGMT